MEVGDEAATQSYGSTLPLSSAHGQSKIVRQRSRDHIQTVRHGERLQNRALRDGRGGGFLRRQDSARQFRDEDGVSGRMPWRALGPERRRRRLGDIEDIPFSAPTEGDLKGEDGEVVTGSQQAAAFVNNMADLVSEGWESMPLVLGGSTERLSSLLTLGVDLVWIWAIVVVVVVGSDVRC